MQLLLSNRHYHLNDTPCQSLTAADSHDIITTNNIIHFQAVSSLSVFVFESVCMRVSACLCVCVCVCVREGFPALRASNDVSEEDMQMRAPDITFPNSAPPHTHRRTLTHSRRDQRRSGRRYTHITQSFTNQYTRLGLLTAIGPAPQGERGQIKIDPKEKRK